MASFRFAKCLAALLLPLLACGGCESSKCLQRTCKSVLTIFVRHPEGVIPIGPFEIQIEAGSESYTCKNQVPEDLDELIQCVRTSDPGDAGTPSDAPDAGDDEEGWTLILGQDISCNRVSTGAGDETECTSLGSSAQQIRIKLPEDVEVPASVTLTATFGDGLRRTEEIIPNYLDVPINGLGCPGVCQTATTTWNTQE